MVSCRVALKSPQRIPSCFPWIGRPTDDAELARQMSERVVANAQSRSQVWKVGSVQHRHSEPPLKMAPCGNSTWHNMAMVCNWATDGYGYDLVWFAFIQHKIAM